MADIFTADLLLKVFELVWTLTAAGVNSVFNYFLMIIRNININIICKVLNTSL